MSLIASAFLSMLFCGACGGMALALHAAGERFWMWMNILAALLNGTIALTIWRAL